jgi:tetratricopeptide (TPR) repeat protein
MPAEMTPQARKFLEETTMKTLLGIPDEALEAVTAIGYQLYQSGRYPEVEILCRGLIAANHKDGWAYALLGATLRRLGKLAEALAAVEEGLRFAPDDSKLRFMRGELCEVIATGQQERITAGSAETASSDHTAVP